MSDAAFYRKPERSFDLRAALRRLAANRRLMLLLAIALPLVLYVLFGNRGIIQRERLEHQKAELQQKIRETEADVKRLQQESKALDGDRKTIEKVAREKHGMVREGETVYRPVRKR